MKGTIVLIGPMGSGKSAVGAKLASRLQLKFIDTDKLVIERAGRSIAEIFEQEGEEAFRKLESEAISEGARATGAVIACGGGAVLEPDNVQTLRASGEVFYLRVSPAVAASRLQSSDDRPLLSRLEEISNERMALYEQAADFEIDAEGSVVEVVDRIVEKLNS